MTRWVQRLIHTRSVISSTLSTNPTVSLGKTLYPHYLVLVGSRNQNQNRIINKEMKGLMVYCHKCLISAPR